ncbi:MULTISPECIES: hypothetical protein [Methylobacteriaceae]|uniref:hypothetical protein n=1 Tax=Methylobacteriaceae TaxID=119045 RepID=UPI000CDB8C64|nr:MULTISPECIES: hypothetical protein [Methylobacteriaceae]MCP1549447.1 hypothetical protein [Methylorubrum zatmanii]MCP1553940.1 hypothetical protein [Methylorubrum extorquens]MCP1579749.1 hypothetical protein [Methylorubrum extorquens]POR40997.1 hypothetical protein CRT23_21130 [Methylobacterium sp. V23]
MSAKTYNVAALRENLIANLGELEMLTPGLPFDAAELSKATKACIKALADGSDLHLGDAAHCIELLSRYRGTCEVLAASEDGTRYGSAATVANGAMVNAYPLVDARRAA